MIFASYTSPYDEEFISKGTTPEEAFQALQYCLIEVKLSETKFFEAKEIFPVQPPRFKKGR
jgi:hypothetical protein